MTKPRRLSPARRPAHPAPRSASLWRARLRRLAWPAAAGALAVLGLALTSAGVVARPRPASDDEQVLTGVLSDTVAPVVRTPAVPRRAVPPTSRGGAAASARASGGGGAAGGDAGIAAERDFNTCKKFPANKRIVKLNVKPETEIGDLISWISSITCKQFLLPASVSPSSKKVTVIAPQLITPDEAFRLFLGAMDSVGLTVEDSGRFYRIIESGKAKQSAMPIYGSEASVPLGANYVKKIARVENGDVNEVSQVLARLKSDQGDVVPYPAQSMLIITDTASNVNSMLRVLDEIDQPTQGEKVWVIHIKNTAAVDMAQKLAEIFRVDQLGGRKGAAAPAPASTPGGKSRMGDLGPELAISKMIPDERSNQLIVIATERAYARLLTLIKRLDVPLDGGDGRIHVYYCEHANCDELAQTLGAITGVAVSGGGAARSRRGATPAPTPTPGATTPPSTTLFEGEVRINFDRPTNALIVMSSLKDYQALRNVIERLDSPRKQVFIEAVIMEISLDKTRTLGASWHAGAFPFLGSNIGLGGFNPLETLQPQNLLTDTSLVGLAAGIFGPRIAGSANALGATTTSVLDVPAFGVLVKALQSNNDVNVLSSPHLLIMNNEDGEITVGQNLPFQGATFGGGSVPGSTTLGLASLAVPVQRQDVALKMKLTPHVNEHDVIRLEVDEEIQDIVSANFNNLGPATSKRSAKTTVVAKDQQTIVIGGLTADRTNQQVTKIPILGDIPILGFFFRNSTTQVQKTNILIAITPYVVNDQADLRRILERKLKEEREFEERFGVHNPVTFENNIDFRRKRGMLEEINRAAKEVETEESEMERIRERDAAEESGPVEVPSAATKHGAGDEENSGVPLPLGPDGASSGGPLPPSAPAPPPDSPPPESTPTDTPFTR